MSKQHHVLSLFIALTAIVSTLVFPANAANRTDTDFNSEPFIISVSAFTTISPRQKDDESAIYMVISESKNVKVFVQALGAKTKSGTYTNRTVLKNGVSVGNVECQKNTSYAIHSVIHEKSESWAKLGFKSSKGVYNINGWWSPDSTNSPKYVDAQ